VVFNTTHEPIDIKSINGGLLLVIKGKAVILETFEDREIATVTEVYPAPKSVVLKQYKQSRGSKYYKEAQLNQRNLFARDGYRCQYCDRHVSDLTGREGLTRDHYIPRDLGGLDEWTNVVTACSTCNHRKDNRSPDQIAQDVQQLETQLRAAEHLEQTGKIKQLTTRLERLRPLNRALRPKAPTVFEILTRRSQRKHK
jgi:5-methylcytosine-specific restriction endonuclease McrA